MVLGSQVGQMPSPNCCGTWWGSNAIVIEVNSATNIRKRLQPLHLVLGEQPRSHRTPLLQTGQTATDVSEIITTANTDPSEPTSTQVSHIR